MITAEQYCTDRLGNTRRLDMNSKTHYCTQKGNKQLAVKRVYVQFTTNCKYQPSC